VNIFKNPNARASRHYGAKQRDALDPESAELVRREISSWPQYRQTPLISLPGLATRMGLGDLRYKDESGRFELGSFKGLGGAYAVYRCVAKAVAAGTGNTAITATDLITGKYRDLISSITVCCATDGNHGRSVAWGAQIFGCGCVIYLHEKVSSGREAAIRRFGAGIVRTRGNYDASVRRVAADATANGWVVISDTSYEDYTTIPRDIMLGYTVMVDEIIDALSDGALPTHVFVQGGVGGLAAAVCARFWWEYEERRPVLVVVEPQRANALFESAKAGKRVALTGDVDTIMACLSCAETSLLAWQILADGVDFFMTIPDESAVEMMRLLATGLGADPPIVAGESGVAGLAGASAAATDTSAARALGLDAGARVLVFGTEGDTDPELYRQLVGRSAEEVLGRSTG
jgi:diaminopropionate ammonia-lyase